MPIAMTPNPAAQLLLLAPWQFFYTRVDELPMVFVALGWLAIVAAVPLRNKPPEIGLTFVGTPPS
jgi:hypothetical protein